MAGKTKLPDATTLRRMRNLGMTLKEIGALYDATPSAVWKRLSQLGEIGPIRGIEELTGWSVEERHKNTGAMRNLMTYNRMELGKEISPEKRQYLEAFVEDMERNDVVLDYHPEAPPNDASSVGGFFFRPRKPSDTTFFRKREAQE